MSDSWIDGKGRSILNFLVNCLKGTIFIKSVDASAYVKDVQLLCELLDGFIQEIGLQYVVQVIMDNAVHCVGVSHCIDSMLEDMGKICWIKEIVESTRSVTKYIYDHTYVLLFMR
jgi:hypothetical protein